MKNHAQAMHKRHIVGESPVWISCIIILVHKTPAAVLFLVVAQPRDKLPYDTLEILVAVISALPRSLILDFYRCHALLEKV